MLKVRLLIRKLGILVVVYVLALATAGSARAQVPAAVHGTIFEDTNGNGQQDEGENGLSGVVVVAIEENTGVSLTATTDNTGAYRLETDPINHTVFVNESSLPFSGALTTSRRAFDLRLPPGATVQNINFGYEQVAPAEVSGVVFADANGDGFANGDEAGIAGVTVLFESRESGDVLSVTTADDGTYRFEAGEINHQVRVDTTSLPFPARLTTTLNEYTVFAPSGRVAANANFGYQEVTPNVITGTVFEDRNANSVQDDDEPGIGGVEIVLFAGAGSLTRYTTDADGAYEIVTANDRFSVSADPSTLPFTGLLTTATPNWVLDLFSGAVPPTLDFGYLNVDPAVLSVMVFEDTNENGVQDDGEVGLPGVTVDISVSSSDSTLSAFFGGSEIFLETDGDGRIEFEFEVISGVVYDVRVNTATLPWLGRLTTGVENYTLDMSPGASPVVAFGYVEAEPSRITGTVFEDLNGDGVKDTDEPGIPGVFVYVYRQDLAPQSQSGLFQNLPSYEAPEGVTVRTDDNGVYSIDVSFPRVLVLFDISQVPLTNPISTTQNEYILRMRPGYATEGVDFGYREEMAEDRPIERELTDDEVLTTDDPTALDNAESAEAPADPPADERENAFDDPDPDLPLPDTLPEDAGEYAQPLPGPWTAYNGPLSFNCQGMSFDQPAAPPESFTLSVEDGGRTLTGINFQGSSATVTSSDTTRGLYTGTITVTEQGGTVTLNFFVQVVTPEYMVGYLTGDVSAQGMSCEAYRPFDMEYTG